MAFSELRATVLRYERLDNLTRVTMENLSNHELREILVGFWARLAPEDRAEHIRELTEYHTNPRSWLSPVAQAIKGEGPFVGAVIDVSKIKRQERGEEATGHG